MDIYVINDICPYKVVIDKNYISKNILITTIDKLLDRERKEEEELVRKEEEFKNKINQGRKILHPL